VLASKRRPADLLAPFGLDDLFALRLRPNPLRRIPAFWKTVASVTARWPEVQTERGASP
jgi:hypothetical protein